MPAGQESKECSEHATSKDASPCGPPTDSHQVGLRVSRRAGAGLVLTLRPASRRVLGTEMFVEPRTEPAFMFRTIRRISKEKGEVRRER